MRLSVIVPVRDGARFLERTLPDLVASLPEGAELIVSDDGSRDDSAEVARRAGARVSRSEARAGPAEARNRGAREAKGDLLVFLDADCRVHADTLSRLTAPFEDPTVAAAFGSYDRRPEARTWVSLYKNLAHHFVHQRSKPVASTFWAACGAVRAAAFRSANGFDARYLRPSIEDVELGYRLCRAGHRIRLVREAQVTHLKSWTLVGLLSADLRDRAIPWARLWRSGYALPRDLNFTAADRVASSLVAVGLVLFPASLSLHVPATAGVACLALAVGLDAPLLLSFARTVSPAFVPVAALLQLLHRMAGILGLAIGLLGPVLPRRPRAT
ncbi:MAG TPA: glycosyltransferase family 2 protein [Vicinamibacteria bacterium]|nr:glycosyltransferase family 2 protein [Vicinamibacteria bacterium]